MKTFAEELRELGQLCHNVKDAALTGEASPIAQELADWCEVATRIIGSVAIDVAQLQVGNALACSNCGNAVTTPSGRVVRAPEPLCIPCSARIADVAIDICSSCLEPRPCFCEAGRHHISRR